MGLFLGFQFRSIDLYACFCTNTTCFDYCSFVVLSEVWDSYVSYLVVFFFFMVPLFCKSFTSVLSLKNSLTKETTCYTQINNFNFYRKLFDLISILSLALVSGCWWLDKMLLELFPSLHFLEEIEKNLYKFFCVC